MTTKKKKGTHTRGGFLPPDHPLYSSGPIVSGRPIQEEKPPKESGTGRAIVGGFLPPEDPMYSRGPMIFGRPDPPKKVRFVNKGLLPPDDPIYSTGPVINGREIGKPYRKMTPEEIERNFQIARDAITKDGWKPGYVYVAGKWEPPSKQDESGKKGGTT